jgi:CDP-glucose 4,6-dehydratase
MTVRTLVTGASGFLGRHLVDALARRGDFVVRIVRDLLCDTNAPATVLGGFAQVERAIAEYEIDTVFHLAAQVQVSTAVTDPTGTLESNVRGTWQVLEACRRQKVKRVIVSSSDKVYGDGEVPYTERQALQPHGIYATSKACADMLAQSYMREYGMSIAITRCGNLYGHGHTNWSTLIPGTIRSVLKGESPRLRSNGQARRDFLYVEDAVDGYLKLRDSDLVGPFNFGGGQAHSVIDVVEKILLFTRSDLKPIIEDNSPAEEISVQWLSIDRAANLLGWTPTRMLEQGLEETVAWYREYLK